MTKEIAIVDHGKGPQLSTSRITVMDVFYYLHLGHDFEYIHQKAMPSLSRAEFDVIDAYVREHYEELVEENRKADEYTQKAIAAQHARGGIFAPEPEGLTQEEQMERMRAKLRALQEKRRNGIAIG